MVYSAAGQTVIISCVTFFLGCLLINFIVDHDTLWTSLPTPSAFDRAEHHYRIFATVPHIVLGTGAFVFGTGIMGHIVKLHKGTQSNTLFDGASLVLYMIAFTLTASNLYRGIKTVEAGVYGDMGRDDTLRVVAASNVIVGAALMGVLMLQIGQGYAERAAEAEMRAFEGAEVKAAKSQ